MYYSHSDYKFLRFEKSKKEGKKYSAVLIRRDSSGREVHVHFGDKDYEHYKDSTGLGLYSNLDHRDLKRRAAYRLRHAKDVRAGYYSPGYFAMRYLW